MNNIAHTHLCRRSFVDARHNVASVLNLEEFTLRIDHPSLHEYFTWRDPIWRKTLPSPPYHLQSRAVRKARIKRFFVFLVSHMVGGSSGLYRNSEVI